MAGGDEARKGGQNQDMWGPDYEGRTRPGQ